MRILFDQGTPVPLRHALTGHAIETAYERGWSSLKNGELIAQAEQAGFEVLLTTDKNLRYQQNLSHRRLAIVVLLTTSWPRIQHATTRIAAALESVSAEGYIEVEIDAL